MGKCKITVADVLQAVYESDSESYTDLCSNLVNKSDCKPRALQDANNDSDGEDNERLHMLQDPNQISK